MFTLGRMGLTAGAALSALVLVTGCGSDAKSPQAIAAAGGSAMTSGGTSSSAAGSGGAGSPTLAGGGGTAGSAGRNPANLPHVVTPCPAVGAPMNESMMAVWEDATPPGVSLDPTFKTPIGTNYGTNSFAISPADTAQIYLGTGGQGLFKTKDCGATWTHINTGRNGTNLDKGGNWTIVVDPVEPDTVYTNAGYGPGGVFKSINGGVDWDQVLSPEVMAAFYSNGFVEHIDMDPTNHLHLTVTPHFTCEGSHAPTCLAETEDGGATWKILDGAPPGMEGFAQQALDSNIWFWGQGYGGLWRTDNRGASWTRVTSGDSYAFVPYFKTPDGTLYVTAAFKVLSSTDKGVNWKTIDTSFNAQVITGGSKYMYTGSGYCVVVGEEGKRFGMAPITDPAAWKVVDSAPSKYSPGFLSYDEDHHFLYASSCLGGFTRATMP